MTQHATWQATTELAQGARPGQCNLVCLAVMTQHATRQAATELAQGDEKGAHTELAQGKQLSLYSNKYLHKCPTIYILQQLYDPEREGAV